MKQRTLLAALFLCTGLFACDDKKDAEGPAVAVESADGKVAISAGSTEDRVEVNADGVNVQGKDGTVKVGADGIQVQGKDGTVNVDLAKIGALAAQVGKAGSGECASGEVCTWKCPDGNCNWTCAAGATCNSSCSGGNCSLTCNGGTCNNTCSGGSCKQACENGTCNFTCSGGSCKQSKGGAATLAATCSGGDCSG